MTFIQDFTPTKILAEPIDIQAWHLNDLAQDDFTEDNTVFILNGVNWSLCIDSQDQANQWIKKIFKKKIFVLNPKKPKYDQTLEHALQNGTPVLLQDMSEEIDSILMPILNPNFVKEGTVISFKIAGD
jgi:dynein heavy chain